MDDSVSILYEKIHPRPEIEFAGVVLNSEKNVKDQQAFSFLAHHSFADIYENKTFESGIRFDDPEEGSSKKVPLISQTRDVFQELQVSSSNQNYLDPIPGIMLNTEILPTLEEPFEIFERFDQEALPRRPKRKINDSENQDEVATKKEEPSLKIKLTKTSPTNWKVDNVRRLNVDQPFLPLQQQSHYPSRPAYNDYMRNDYMRIRPNFPPDNWEPARTSFPLYSTASTSANRFGHNWAHQPPPSEERPPPWDSCTSSAGNLKELLTTSTTFLIPPYDQEPAQTAPYATASTSYNPNWMYQPPAIEQQPPHQDPYVSRFSTDLDERIQRLQDLKQLAFKRSLPSADGKAARIPPRYSTAGTSFHSPPPHEDQPPPASPPLSPDRNWQYQPPLFQQQTPQEEPHLPRFSPYTTEARAQVIQDLDKLLGTMLSSSSADQKPIGTLLPNSTASTSTHPPPHNQDNESTLRQWEFPLPPAQQQSPRKSYRPRFSARMKTLAKIPPSNGVSGSTYPFRPADHTPTRIPPSLNSRASTSAPPAPFELAPLFPQPPLNPKKEVVHVENSRSDYNKLIVRRLRADLRALRRFVASPLPLLQARYHRMNAAPHPLLTLQDIPELTTADKPQPQESYQKEKKLKTWKEEFEKDDYNTLVALSDMGLVANVEPFECPICFTEVPVGEGVLLHECLHSFCRECLEGTIKHSDTASVRCPFGNEDYLCESHLQEREIKSLVTPDLYEKYLARSLALAESQAPDSFHCKTPDCPGWCLIEDVTTFACPVCNRTNCLMCGAVHEGRSCRQYQDWLLELESDTSNETKKTRECLKGMVEEGKAMECPVCHVILMKVSGCDALTCRMCKTQLCWVTKGTRWGPKGHGDTSGGCKCNLNGVPCHPQCTGCH